MCRHSFSSLRNVHRDCLLQISLVPILDTTCLLAPLSPIPRDFSEIEISGAGNFWGLKSSFPWEAFLLIMALITKQAFGFNLPCHCWIVPGKAEKISKPWHQHSLLGFLRPPETKQAGSSFCLHSTCPHATGTWCTSCPLFARLFQCQLFGACGGGEWDTGKCLWAAMRLTDL